MNPIFSNVAREVQTIRCCGLIYKRWRFKGGQFSKRKPDRVISHQGRRATHAVCCAVCGERLHWPMNHHPLDRLAVRKAEAQERYFNRKVDFLLSGKNSIGQPWQRTPNFATPHERIEARRARGLKAWNNRVDRLKATGRTTRGTKPKYRRGPAPSIKAWQNFRSQNPSNELMSWDSLRVGGVR